LLLFRLFNLGWSIEEVDFKLKMGRREVSKYFNEWGELRGEKEKLQAELLKKCLHNYILSLQENIRYRLVGRALDEWVYRKGVKLNFIRPGKPIENAYAESFSGRFRDECLNTNWFLSLGHARSVIEEWRRDYNEVRPHSSLKGATPKEYAEITAETLVQGALTPGESPLRSIIRSGHTRGNTVSARHHGRRFWTARSWRMTRCWIDYTRQITLSERSQLSDDVLATTITQYFPYCT